jgi:hypothetical protein
MIMEAVMYGYTPIARIENLATDPPDKRFKIFTKLLAAPPPVRSAARASRSTPGTGT